MTATIIDASCYGTVWFKKNSQVLKVWQKVWCFYDVMLLGQAGDGTLKLYIAQKCPGTTARPREIILDK